MQNRIRIQRKKRAISDVVAVVLILSISILSLTILAFYINQIVHKPSLSPEKKCLDMQLKSPIRIEDSCFNVKTSDVEVVLKRESESEFDFRSLDFILDFENDRSRWRCGESESCEECILLDEGERKTYYFDVKEFGKPESVKIVVSGCIVDMNRDFRNC